MDTTTRPMFDFTDYITERTHNFTGREWVFAEIEQWLARPDAPRYFIITGEPGIGKTALAGRLTQIRSIDATHFCIARQADTIDPLNFLRSISHQLTSIEGFAQSLLKEKNVNIEVNINVQENIGQVVGVQIENLMGGAESATIAFSRAVASPLRQLYADGFDRQLVILVDALDEAMRQPGAETIVSLLENARSLPESVRFLLTARPDADALRHFEELRLPYLQLDAGRKENLQDIQEYVVQRIEASEVLQTRLREQDTPKEAFVERLTTASRGNFLYLVWLLRGIEEGTQRFETLDDLPEGLAGIYREFLRTRTVGEHRKDWQKTYRPLLGILAAAQAALTAEQLATFSGLSQQDVTDLLLDVRQFLAPEQSKQGQYQLYHQSLPDFFQREEDAKEFWIDLTTVHHQIAGHYIENYASRWSECDLYGLRHLPIHLLKVGELATLGELVCTRFLQNKAELLGNVETLINTRQIAEALSLGGESHWNDLLRCANVYCELVERLQQRPELLMDMIRRGQTSQVEVFLDAEPDQTRRGLLSLAASMLLTQGEGVEFSGQLRQRALADLKDLIAGLLPKYESAYQSSNTTYIAAALLTDEEIGFSTEETPAENSALCVQKVAANPKEIPRIRGPFGYVLLGYLTSSLGRIFFSSILPIGLLAGSMSGSMWYFGIAELMQSWKDSAPFLLAVSAMIVVPIVVLLCVAFTVLWAIWIDREFTQQIQNRSGQIEQILCQFHRGVITAKAEQQHQITVRALRFHMLMQCPLETPPWEQVTLRLLTEQLSSCRNPVDAAELIQLATGMGTRCCDALIIECRKLGSERLASIYRETANRPHRTKNEWQLFRIYVATSDLTCEPELLLSLYEQWSHISKSTQVDEFLTWLEQTAPLTSTWNSGNESQVDAIETLDTLDSVLLAAIVEVEQIAGQEELSLDELEEQLRRIWQHSYARYATMKEQAQAHLENFFIQRGRALKTEIYPDPVQRKKLYRTSLPPRSGEQLSNLYPTIKQHLETGKEYAKWDMFRRFNYIHVLIEQLGTLEKFKMEDKEDWHNVLRWWFKIFFGTTPPSSNKDISKWYAYVNKNFVYRFNWGVGSIIALAIEETDEDVLLSIENWPETRLPWIVFWLKELIIWGTLEPVAAYLLARRIEITRAEAEETARKYYEEQPDIQNPDELLNAVAIRKWAQELSGDTEVQKDASSETKLPALIPVTLLRDFSQAPKQRWRVVPVETDTKLFWYDPAGVPLASCEKFEAWQPHYLDTHDFMLISSEKAVSSKLYIYDLTYLTR